MNFSVFGSMASIGPKWPTVFSMSTLLAFRWATIGRGDSFDSLSVLTVSDLADRRLGAEPVADVGQVAQGGRQVALVDVAVQVLVLAAADGLDEVVEVVLVAAAR